MWWHEIKQFFISDKEDCPIKKFELFRYDDDGISIVDLRKNETEFISLIETQEEEPGYKVKVDLIVYDNFTYEGN